jgi:coenzyme PQQ biosynthesis protein PqqD
MVLGAADICGGAEDRGPSAPAVYPMTVAPDRPRHVPHVIGQLVEESFVLLNVRSGEYFTLDEVGTRIWELCDGTRSVGDIADLLASEYDAPAETIYEDVRELVADLRREAMLDLPA